MRPIRFRAWNKKTKTMIDLQKLTVFATELPGLFLPNSPETELMQFTGLLDTDGNELYEGDIVGHYVKGLDGEIMESFRSEIKWWPNMVEVTKAKRIGNIYENPELIK